MRKWAFLAGMIVVGASLVFGSAARSEETRSSAAWTVRIGKGAGPWKIGMPFTVRPGLVASERFPKNEHTSGCTAWARVDHYRDVQVGWDLPAGAPHANLADVATSRPGDRSGEGFTIGTSRLAAVLARHPQKPTHPRSAGVLGLTLVVFAKKTGDESATWLDYWFDAANTLTAIETGAGGC